MALQAYTVMIAHFTFDCNNNAMCCLLGDSNFFIFKVIVIETVDRRADKLLVSHWLIACIWWIQSWRKDADHMKLQNMTPFITFIPAGDTPSQIASVLCMNEIMSAVLLYHNAFWFWNTPTSSHLLKEAAFEEVFRRVINYHNWIFYIHISLQGPVCRIRLAQDYFLRGILL